MIPITVNFELMATAKLDKEYWDSRYADQQTGWDAGGITSPLKAYIDQLTDKNLKILIPGAGNAYEAEYLFNRGFKNVSVIDIAHQPLQNLKSRIPAFPEKNLICGDFFDHSGQYDLILEQTFFCALPLSKRAEYAMKMSELLVQGGSLAGVLFNTEFVEGPPFGGSAEEYRSYFIPFFKIKTFEACYNSIKPRDGRELFMILVKQ